MSVYFAAAGAYLKIGFSDDPFARSANVTTHGKRPKDLRRGAKADLIGWVPGNRLTEICWHARFSSDHVRGEWFYTDPEVVRPLIWEDPCGVDIQRMSALAVFAAHKHPELTRDQIERAGIRVEAVSEADALASLNRFLSGVA